MESSGFTNEKRQLLSLSIWEAHLLWAPLQSPQRSAIILCIEANFFLLKILGSLLSWSEWTFFFSLWPFYTQLLYTFAALSHQPWDHASPHPSSNSNLLEGCLKLAYHDPSPFCAFSHNTPSSWNVLPFHLPCWAHSYLSLGLRKMGQLGKAPQLLPDFWREILCVQVFHLPDNTLTLSEQKGEFAPSRTCPLCLISYAVVQTKRV